MSPKQLLSKLVVESAPSLLNLDLIETGTWSVAVTPQSGYVSRCEIERLCGAVLPMTNECYFISPTDNIATATLVTVLPNPKSIEEAIGNSISTYLITDEKTQFVFLTTSDDFNTIAGPRTFVERALGSSLEAARLDWERLAGHPTLPDEVRKLYQVPITYYPWS